MDWAAFATAGATSYPPALKYFEDDVGACAAEPRTTGRDGMIPRQGESESSKRRRDGAGDIGRRHHRQDGQADRCGHRRASGGGLPRDPDLVTAPGTLLLWSAS
jgi:hypothetical protein